MSLLNSYSKEELSLIVANANSWRDLGKKLGYNCNSGALKKNIQKRVEEFNIDTSHFKTVARNATERNENNIFIENSTASQKVLRNWYYKGEYTDYKCSICGLEPIWNNYPLTLILDHINGINNDDRLENLRWVCPNCNMQLPTTNRVKNCNIKKYYCIDCGKEVIHSTTKRCFDCESKHRKISISEMKVTREELKKLIRNNSFASIGRQFKVSDNTIRKWCDKLNLPRKVSEIKNFSDEDWKKL